VYEQKRQQLKKLLLLEEEGLIDLLFTDESGFNLTPSVPYGWAPIGQQLRIRSAKDRVTNLFGLLSRNGKLQVYSTSQNINSDMIIECVDDVASKVIRPTVLVFDNAPWHKSQKVLNKQEEWAKKNVYLFFLPTYSPHLNLIETLWRKIKYEWLKAEDYSSVKTLKGAIFNIIKKYDDEFCINFSKNFN
jgi:transposase